MCDTCNCATRKQTAYHIPGKSIDLPENDRHHHQSEKDRVIQVELDVLSKNNHIAKHNREYFENNAILALNLVSSPGSGKTTTLEKTIASLGGTPLAVIEGDQQTSRDAERIDATGAPVIQVNTGTGCHLDADMIHKAMHQLDLQQNSILFIENVGNLVCPAMFDLGEAYKVAVISVTEGEDKPQKYPTMFHAADVCLINKIDLLPYVNFGVERCKEYARQVNNDLQFFEISATTGQGMEEWINWLKAKVITPTTPDIT